MSDENSRPKQRVPARWWVVWALSFLGSLSPLLIHYTKNVSEIIQPLRYPWGLMPIHFLMFRWFGEIGHYVTGAVGIIGLLAWFDPKHVGRRTIIFGAALVFGFLFLYGRYLGSILADVIVELEAEQGESLKP